MAARTPPPLTLPGGRPLHDAYDAAEGTDHLAIPHVFSFASLIGGANKTYWHERFDEAMRHSRENALAMRRDAFPMSLLRERKLAVMSLPWYLEVPDPKNRVQAETRALLTQNLRATRGFRRMLWAWLEAIWYGRYGCQFSWKWRHVDGKRCLAVRKWKPLNGDKIGYTWDDVPYVLVGSRAAQLPGVEMINTTRARAVKLSGAWRERFVIHQHEIDDGDYFEAEGADGIHGVGVRSRVYWLDFLKRDYLEWTVTYLERVGLGITLWKYPVGVQGAKERAEEAARDNSRRVNITVPVYEGQGGMVGGVERIEVSTGGIEVLRAMIDGLDSYIERYMVGQAGSARSSASGIGNEAASEFMSSTKDQIRDNDALLLGETITGDEEEPGLVWLMQKHSCPETLDGKPGGFPVSLKFGLERTLNSQRVSTIKDVNQLGLAVRKDDIYNAAGLSRPEPHDDVLEGQKPQQQPGLGGMLGGQQPGGNPALPAGDPGQGGEERASPEDIDAFLADLGLGGEQDAGEAAPGDDRADPADVDAFLADLFDDQQPQQMARRDRARQYGWERGKSRTGKTKWIGNAEDAGDVRYQENEPGAGEKNADPEGTLREALSDLTPDQLQALRAKLKGSKGSGKGGLLGLLRKAWRALTGADRKETTQDTTTTRDFAHPQESQALRDYVSGAAEHSLPGREAHLGGGKDTLLEGILAESGRDGPPELLPLKHLRALKRKRWTIAYRSVTTPEYAEQIRSGAFHGGTGQIGNGMYVMAEKADGFRGWFGDNAKDAAGAIGWIRQFGTHIVAVAIPPTARTVTAAKLRVEQGKYRTALARRLEAGELTRDEYGRHVQATDDLGRFAALMNYDVIIGTSGEQVILNRAICVVSEENLSP